MGSETDFEKPMPNLAVVLKAEISRLARREVRVELDKLRKDAAAQRSEISALKRQVVALEKTVHQKVKGFDGPRTRQAAPAPDATPGKRAARFSASSLASHRARLGISAEQYGLLVGTSGQSIYAWEQERSVPRAGNVASIAALRRLGKRAVAAKLAELAPR